MKSTPENNGPLEASGLSENAARFELERSGFNELPSAKRRNWAAILLNVFREPMFILLLTCATTYFLLGDIQEGLILYFSLMVVVTITLVQELKSERALEALKDLSSPRALVVRDGREFRIPGREVVPGDLVLLREGDRIAADGVLTISRHLRVDESLLTGESFPVTKVRFIEGEVLDKQSNCKVFSGSLVIGGSGAFKVTGTGINTEIGKIGKSLQLTPPDTTHLQKQMSHLVKLFAAISIAFSILIMIAYGIREGNWVQGFLAGIATAMSLLPEELPVILTVFFAIGAWRISKRNVLTRQVTAIENLGAISTLCVDKTGTLTKNEMVVRALNSRGSLLELPGNPTTLSRNFSTILEYGVLASHKDTFDPMEKAIRKALESTAAHSGNTPNDGYLVREYPLSHELLAMSCIWEICGDNEYLIATKGAPETVLNLCQMTMNERDFHLAEMHRMAALGLRVLGIAQGKYSEKLLPESQSDFTLKFLGLIGFEDPIRQEAKPAIQECYQAGIRVLMMTGDHAETARSIARQIELKNPEKVVTGAELQALTDDDLRDQIKNTNVFARMVPEQKLRIVKALREGGALVAMTGDGVNDAPSLKWADIGIAMGKRGTDVAREASDIVLLDDNFSSIVSGIRLGRRIYDNIQKAISYIFAIHVPIAGMAILPVIFRTPLVLMPVHIVFLELIIDPASSLVFETEPEEKAVMKKGPRNTKLKSFRFLHILKASFYGFISLVMVFGLYCIALMQGESASAARTIAFTALTFSNLGLIAGNLSYQNRAFPWIALGTCAFLAMILYVPFLQRVFQFSQLSPLQIGVCLLVGLVTVMLPKFGRRNSLVA